MKTLIVHLSEQEYGIPVIEGVMDMPLLMELLAQFKRQGIETVHYQSLYDAYKHVKGDLNGTRDT